MRKASRRPLVGLLHGLGVAAGGALVAPVVLGAGCADVFVQRDEIAPTILSVEPNKGPAEGGSLVVITGRDLDPGVVVRFGGERAEQVQRLSAETLNVIAPPGSGEVAVSVENPNQKVATLEGAFTYEGAGAGCAVIATTPAIGATGVPITGELRLSFSAPIDVVSLQDAVKLRHIGGEEIPIDVALSAGAATDVILQPKRSLRFWGSYLVTTGDGVLAQDGGACAPAALAFATVVPEAVPRPLRPAPANGVVVSGGTVITSSEGYRGLQIFDAKDPAATKLTAELLTDHGPRALVKRGSRIYVPAAAGGVRIFDVEDPAAPVEIGHGGTPGRAFDVAFREKDGRTFLFVADGEGGVRVLDATDPAAVKDMGALYLGPGTALAVAADGDRIAVAQGSRFYLVDLPDPADVTSLVVHGSVDVGAVVSDVVLDGGRLFVSRSLLAVTVYDIADPAAPVLLAEGLDPDGPCPGACKHNASFLRKDGDELFVAFGRGGVRRYSIGADGSLTTLTTYKVPGDVRALDLTATHVYAAGEEGLLIFERGGAGEAPIWFDPNGHGLARAMHVRGDFAYVAASLRGLQTFSLASPEAPELLGRDDTPSSLAADYAAAGVSSSGDVLAVGDARAGVTLFDLTDAKDPVLGGTADTPDGVTVVVQKDKLTFACDDNAGVVAVDTSDVKAPVLLQELPFNDIAGSDACRGLALAGDLLYVARATGVGVMDITDPSALAWKGLVTLPSKDAFSSVQKVGQHLLATTNRFDYEGAANNVAHLVVLDLADPVSPKVVFKSADLGRASHVAVVADKAFVGAGNRGVLVFDIADITSPVLEGAIPTAGNVVFVAPGKDVLYVAQGAGGLQAIRTGPLPGAAPKE